jgi:dTDP-4-amino-4,6-dideoxygalactose transaminase
MAADPTLMRFGRLPPAGSPITPAECARALGTRDPAQALIAGLRAILGLESVALYASGREALRVAFTHLASQSGRAEVAVPAYTCFSVAAAAVAAGLRVRLVDVTPAGQIDLESLARTPLEDVSALLVSSLFGVPEPIGAIRERSRAAGCAVIDDAAQSLGAQSPEGRAGARGQVGVLSFGRGKPLSALGGGALVWNDPDPSIPAPPPAAARRLAGVARALAYDLALHPVLFLWLASVPSLGIGETRFEPDFTRGGIDGASLALAAALVPGLERACRERAERAERIGALLRDETGFVPLLAGEGAEGCYPRLGVLAPSAYAREAALEALTPLGAARSYPVPLDQVAALRAHLIGESALPGAREFSARVFTLPTHKGLRASDLQLIARSLAALR